MTFSPGPASFIRGPKSASPSNTRGGSRVPEWGPLGSVRGALSNERPYRDLRNVVANYPFERSRRVPESSRILARSPAGPPHQRNCSEQLFDNRVTPFRCRFLAKINGTSSRSRSFTPVPLAGALRALRSGRRATNGIDGQRTGRSGAFGAARVLAARRSNIREWYCPQARIAGHLTFHPLVRFRAHGGFLSARSALPSSVTPLLHTAG